MTVQSIDQLNDRLAQYADRAALIYEDKAFSYQEIIQFIAQWQDYLVTNKTEYFISKQKPPC